LRDGVNRALSVRLQSYRPVPALPGSVIGAEVGTAVDGEHRYNPGGVVPEVQEPAAWGPFAWALAALAGLLLLPGLVRLASPRNRSGSEGGPGQDTTPKGRIRLKESTPSRVRLK